MRGGPDRRRLRPGHGRRARAGGAGLCVSLAARLTAHTEVLLLLVILLLGRRPDPGQPLFPDPLERRRPDRELLGHGRPGAGRVRRAGGGRDRHLVRGDRLGRAIRHGLCRHRLGPAGAAVHRARACRRPGARLPQRGADLLSARRLDHHHHRHHERLLRAPDVADRRQVDLRPARLVGRPAWCCSRPRPPTATWCGSPCRSWWRRWRPCSPGC